MPKRSGDLTEYEVLRTRCGVTASGSCSSTRVLTCAKFIQSAWRRGRPRLMMFGKPRRRRLPVKLRRIALLGALLAGAAAGLVPIALPAAPAAKQASPIISEEASAAVLRMGQALS